MQFLMIKVNGKFKCGQLNEREKRRQIAKMLYGFVFAYLTHYTKVIMSFEKSRLVPGSWNHTNKISLPVERIYFYFLSYSSYLCFDMKLR